MTRLEQNPPADRLRYIAKQYAKYPIVTFSMIDVIAHTVGEDGWKTAVTDAAIKAMGEAAMSDDAAEINSAYRASRLIERVIYTTTEPLFTSLKNEVAEATPILVEMVSELRGFKERNQSEGTFLWMSKQLADKAKPVVTALQATRRDDGDRIAPHIIEEAREYVEAVRFFKTRGTAIGQWAEKEKPNLTSMSFDEVKEAIEDFDSSGKKPPTQHEIAHTFDDGWTVQLLPGTYCEEEKDAMQHCGRARMSDSVLYSIRDPKGFPHVTIEWNENLNKAIQTFGKQNKTPAEKYKKYVDSFMATLNVKKLPPDIQAIVDWAQKNVDWIDEEHLEGYATKWLEVVRNVSDFMEWMDEGVYFTAYQSVKSMLGEDVSPAEFRDFPWAVQRAIEEDDGGRRTEGLIKTGRIASSLAAAAPYFSPAGQASLPGVDVSPPSMSAAQIKKRKAISDVWRHQGFYPDSEGSKGLLVFPAEDWIATGFIEVDPTFDYQDVKKWAEQGISPDVAFEWMTEDAADGSDTEFTPETVRRLIDRGISPEETEGMDVNESTDLQDVLDWLSSRGIEKNRKRRTSREAR